MSLNLLVDYSSEDSIRFNISSLPLHGIMSVVGIAASGADVAERLTVMLGNIVKQTAIFCCGSGASNVWCVVHVGPQGKPELVLDHFCL